MLKRFAFNKTSSGLQDDEKCCLNRDGYFIKITEEKKDLIIIRPAFFFEQLLRD